jgi:hypothetical protein
MDFASAEDSGIVKAAAAVVAVVICAALGLRSALDNAIGAINTAVTRGFIVVEHADRIVAELDQLGVAQRALLTTGAEQFSAGVAENVTEIIAEVSALQQLRPQDPLQKAQIAKVTQSVSGVLKFVGATNELQRLCGSPAALALFDADADSSIVTARLDAIHLGQLATERALHRVRAQSGLRSALEVLF